MTTKFCPKCDTDRPVEDFPANASRSDGRGGHCRLCMREATKKWKANNPEIKRLHAKIYYANKRLAKGSTQPQSGEVANKRLNARNG